MGCFFPSSKTKFCNYVAATLFLEIQIPDGGCTFPLFSNVFPQFASRKFLPTTPVSRRFLAASAMSVDLRSSAKLTLTLRISYISCMFSSLIHSLTLIYPFSFNLDYPILLPQLNLSAIELLQQLFRNCGLQDVFFQGPKQNSAIMRP